MRIHTHFFQPLQRVPHPARPVAVASAKGKTFDIYQWTHFGPFSWDIAHLMEGDIVPGEIRSIDLRNQRMTVNLVGVHRKLGQDSYRARGIVEFNDSDPSLLQYLSPSMTVPLVIRFLRTLDTDLDVTLSYDDYQKKNNHFDAVYNSVHSSRDTHAQMQLFHRMLSAIDDMTLRHPSYRLSSSTSPPRTPEEMIHQALHAKVPEKLVDWPKRKFSPAVRFFPQEIAHESEATLNSNEVALLALGLAQKGFTKEAGDCVARYLNEYGSALIKNLIRNSIENRCLLTGAFYRLTAPRFRKSFLLEILTFFRFNRQFPHLQHAYLHANLKF